MGRSSSSLIPTWWALFVSSFLIGNVDFVFPLWMVLQGMLVTEILSQGLAIAAAILFARVVGDIAEHQNHLQSAGVAHVFD